MSRQLHCGISDAGRRGREETNDGNSTYSPPDGPNRSHPRWAGAGEEDCLPCNRPWCRSRARSSRPSNSDGLLSVEVPVTSETEKTKAHRVVVLKLAERDSAALVGDGGARVAI